MHHQTFFHWIWICRMLYFIGCPDCFTKAGKTILDGHTLQVSVPCIQMFKNRATPSNKKIWKNLPTNILWKTFHFGFQNPKLLLSLVHSVNSRIFHCQKILECATSWIWFHWVCNGKGTCKRYGTFILNSFVREKVGFEMGQK